MVPYHHFHIKPVIHVSNINMSGKLLDISGICERADKPPPPVKFNFLKPGHFPFTTCSLGKFTGSLSILKLVDMGTAGPINYQVYSKAVL